MGIVVPFRTEKAMTEEESLYKKAMLFEYQIQGLMRKPQTPEIKKVIRKKWEIANRLWQKYSALQQRRPSRSA